MKINKMHHKSWIKLDIIRCYGGVVNRVEI